MLLSHHRKAIVRAIIAGLSTVDAGHEVAFKHEEQHRQGATCFITSLFFPDKIAEMQTTVSEYGAVWMGLWLDNKVVIGEDGYTMFPRWLAEVLNEECDAGIEEEDVLD